MSKIRDRDELWCRAVIESGLDPRQMHAVVARFNEIRPDQSVAGDPSLDMAFQKFRQIVGSPLGGTAHPKERDA